MDDRRVISGIINVLKSGGRWIDVSHQNTGRGKPSTATMSAGRQGACSGSTCSTRLRRRRAARASLARQPRREGPSLELGGKGENQAIGRRAADGRPKIPCVDGRRMPSALVPHRRPSRRVQSGRGTFGAASALPNPARTRVTTRSRNPQASRGRGAIPNIPPKANRKWKNCFSRRSLSSAQRHQAHILPLEDFRAIAAPI